MLDDVKVLDFTANDAGLSTAAIFTDFAATVIPVETTTGDTARTYVPLVYGKHIASAWVNRGKQSLLDMKDLRSVE